jgi:acetamidase/formamidase
MTTEAVVSLAPGRPLGTIHAEAPALASTCVDLRITQVANQTWGVHAVLPAGAMQASG